MSVRKVGCAHSIIPRVYFSFYLALFHVEGTWKILTYPNEIRKSGGVDGEERQQKPPHGHFRFRSTVATAPPPPPPPHRHLLDATPAFSQFSPAPSSSSFTTLERDSRYWKTEQDASSLKCTPSTITLSTVLLSLNSVYYTSLSFYCIVFVQLSRVRTSISLGPNFSTYF